MFLHYERTGNPIVTNGHQNTRKLSITHGGFGPRFNTPFLGPTPLTTPNGSMIFSHLLAQWRHKFPTGYNGQPHIHPKIVPYRGRSVPLLTPHILGPTRPTTSHGTQIKSAVFPLFTGQTDTPRQSDRQRQTDRPTDKNVGLQRKRPVTIDRLRWRSDVV